MGSDHRKSVLLIIGALTSPDKSAGHPIPIIGGLLFFFSPVLSGIWLWWGRRKMRAKAREAEAEILASERQNAEDQRRNDALRHKFLERQRLIDSVDRHKAALRRNLDRAVSRNDYGVRVGDTTDNALEEFFASIALDMEVIAFDEATELVFEQLDFRKAEERLIGFDATNLPFDGHAFENWVAEALATFGWEAEVTTGSGDQGIDVIARKEGKTIGLQCKLYSTPIGNKAIQEAHAGKVYYGLDAAGVLTNASFTSSARDLASVTGIKLFSHHDIPTLFETAFKT